MDTILFFILISVLKCGAWSSQEMLSLAKNRVESNAAQSLIQYLRSRRADLEFDPHETQAIIGAPSMPSHLPEAEPILPGHTLIRPALGMLKSALKFPHRELENGFGVDGNIDNVGIRYDGRNERVLYSGFRRMPADYIMVLPDQKDRNDNPGFSLSSVVLDTDRQNNAQNKLLRKLKEMRKPIPGKVILYVVEYPGRQKPSTAFSYFPSLFEKGHRDELKSQKSSDKYSYYLRPQTDHTQKSLNLNKLKSILLNLRRDKNEEESLNRKKDIENYPATAEETFTPINKLKISNPSNPKRWENDNDVFLYKDDEQPMRLPLNEEVGEEEKFDKKQWFYKSKHMFDNIKISADAPDFDKFMPTEPPNPDIRQWWFYNQVDYTNLEKE